MAENLLDIPTTVHEAFKAFEAEPKQFALPLRILSGNLQSLPAIPYPRDQTSTFQSSLSQLEKIIDTKTPLYLIVRRNGSLIAITYAPYLAEAEIKQLYLSNRHSLLQHLGEAKFSMSLICKEPGEITDVRSWDERDGNGESWKKNHEHDDDCETCVEEEKTSKFAFKDFGHKKTKCRLCDRRMKNEIEPDAIKALSNLGDGGDCVQISVDIPTTTLILNFHERNISPTTLLTKFPLTTPSYTFYRHSTSNLLYFIFFSPDIAPVKVRMTHTMAVPGLVNVIAKEQGVEVDQKIEIHDVEDLVFEEGDERIGRFRSVYLLNGKRGTESVWEGMPVS